MTPDRDSRLAPTDQPDDDFDDEEAPRSILSTTWFRIVLVGVVVVIVGAVAVPYVLDVVNPPPAPFVASTPRPSAVTPAPARPATPAIAADNTATRSSAAAQTMTPVSTPAPASAPVTPSPAPPVATPPAAAPTPMKPREVAAAPAETKPAPIETAKPLTPAKLADPAPKVAAKPVAAAPERVAAARETPARPPAATEGGDYFVQVGAFKDQETARRVASRLRAQNYPVDESVKRGGGAAVAVESPRPAPRAATTASGADRYDVIVTGGPPTEISAKLTAKGLAAEPAGDGVRIRPSLPLRDAIALSKDLNNEGFKVQVRRGGGGAPIATAAAPAKAMTVSDGDGGGVTLYRVRVGGYPDRATAVSVMRALQAKGYDTFIAKGRE